MPIAVNEITDKQLQEVLSHTEVIFWTKGGKMKNMPSKLKLVLCLLLFCLPAMANDTVTLQSGSCQRGYLQATLYGTWVDAYDQCSIPNASNTQSGNPIECTSPYEIKYDYGCSLGCCCAFFIDTNYQTVVNDPPSCAPNDLTVLWLYSGDCNPE